MYIQTHYTNDYRKIYLCKFQLWALKFGELLVSLGVGGDLYHVESNSLGNRSALASGNNVTNGDTESRREVHWHVLVSLLVSVVLWHIVQVVSSHNNSTVHLGGDNDTSQNLTTDRDQTSERALLVDVGTIDSSSWCLETQAGILIPSLSPLRGLQLRVVEDVRLLQCNTLVFWVH